MNGGNFEYKYRLQIIQGRIQNGNVDKNASFEPILNYSEEFLIQFVLLKSCKPKYNHEVLFYSEV